MTLTTYGMKIVKVFKRQPQYITASETQNSFSRPGRMAAPTIVLLATCCALQVVYGHPGQETLGKRAYLQVIFSFVSNTFMNLLFLLNSFNALNCENFSLNMYMYNVKYMYTYLYHKHDVNTFSPYIKSEWLRDEKFKHFD